MIQKKIYGLTIIEVMISTLILLGLMSICSQILIWSLQTSQKQKYLDFIRNECAKSINWLIKDLSQSTMGSLYMTDYPSPDVPVGISFLSPISPTSIDSASTSNVALPKWEVFVIYYLKPDSSGGLPQKYILHRATYSNSYYSKAFNGNMSTPQILIPVDFKGICSGLITGSSDRIVGRNIYQLTLSDINAAQGFCTINVTTVNKIKDEEILASYNTKVVLRNTYIDKK